MTLDNGANNLFYPTTCTEIFEPCHEKTYFFCIYKNKGSDQLPCDQCLYFWYIDSTNLKFQASSYLLWLFSLNEHYHITSKPVIETSNQSAQLQGIPRILKIWTQKKGLILRGSINNFLNFLYLTSNAKRL